MFNVLLMTEAPAGNNIMLYAPIIIMIGVMFWMSSRSRKKQEKEASELKDSLEVGDEVVTIGGIVARVVKIEEHTLLLESGSDRSRLRVQKNAVAHNNSANDRLAEKKKAQQDAQQAAKAAKKK